MEVINKGAPNKPFSE